MSVSLMKRMKKVVPLSARRYLRKGWAFSGRLNDLVMGRDRMVPWKQYALSIGGGDFEEVGQEYLRYFKEHGRLEPHHHVLDVGCGIGRMAVPLTGYLTTGRYTGFDAIEQSIKWCNKRIGSRYPNFRFDHADIYNEHYNPTGRLKALEFTFPYSSHTFDFVFLISVFTHMMPPEAEHYLVEIARVLKPGGRCLITSTLLNEESERLIEAGRSHLDYRYKLDGIRTVEKDEPETSVAHTETWIREQYRKNGIIVDEPIRYGTWCGRENGLAFQDFVIGIKTPSRQK